VGHWTVLEVEVVEELSSGLTYEAVEVDGEKVA